MCTWLGDSSSSNMVIALVDGGLHLLKELVDVHQVSFGSEVAHWR
jgi:hypothetical protein